MSAPLDEKGLEAAKLAWTGDARLGLYPEQEAALIAAIRAYLSAVALPDELEVAGWVMGSSFTTDPLMADYWGKAAKAVTGSDQAHSTIAALRAKLDQWDAWAEGLTPSQLDAGMRNLAAKEKENRERAETAEAEVQRLTEDNEALRGVVSECASALPNGAFVHPTASLEFMAKLPGEVKSVSDRQEVRIKALEEALGNMRCPRPCNHRPDEFDAKDCVAAGECGCGAHILNSREKGE